MGGADHRTIGKFLSLEGGEGAGKSTHVRMLADALETTGLNPVVTREPGGTPSAEIIRGLLVDGDVDRWQPMTEALLHCAARLEHVKNTIEPALAEGRWVITDRFADSSVAYQGYGHNLGGAAIDRLHHRVFGDVQPVLTIILDIPVDQGLARARRRQDGEDRYERMGVEFHELLRDGFLDIARRNPKRCTVIDATEDPDTVHKWIRTIVYNRLGVELK